MEYKFIILLFFIAIVLFIVTSENNALRRQIDEMSNKVINRIDYNFKVFQTDLGLCVRRIKSMNGEYVEQVRRMNEYGSQPIVATHFTDSDSNTGKGIGYLSDIKKDFRKQKITDDVLLSADVPKQQDFNIVYRSDRSEKSHNKKTSVNDSYVQNNIEEINLNNTNDAINITNITNTKSHTDCSDNGSKSSKSSKKIYPTSDLISHENSVKESDKNDDSEQSNDTNDTNGTKNSSENSGSDGMEIELDESAIKKIRRNQRHSSESSGDYNSYEQDDENDDKHSVETGHIKEITLESLKSVNGYTFEDLKKMAKILLIPLTKKEGKSRRQLRKDELYEEIKKALQDKEEMS